jgi:succinate-semialdehyde dehydrogenase/glutarate-semialdehyde dehydrogenase
MLQEKASHLKTVGVPALNDPSLFRTQAYVDGAWVDADNKAAFNVNNPANGSIIGTVPNMGATETARAVAAANAALPAWRAKTAKLVIANQPDLAQLMTAEQGKPLAEASAEVVYGASFIEWFAEEGKRLYGDVIPTPLNDRRLVVIKQAIGVVGAITPWNFPNAMITRKTAPALAAGCTVVLKPAEQTPYSALALAVLAERAGFPKGVFNIVTCDIGNAPKIGGELTGNPMVRKITFTGSTEVGRLLMRQSADQIKKVSLELGGNAPFVVFDDADLDQAIEGAMASKFRNAGQTCVCANRILVQEGIYDEFARKLVEKVKAMKVGAGTEPGVNIGPLIDAQGFDKAKDHVSDAVAKGAKVEIGGKPHALGGTFFEPTVLTGVDTSMKVSREETFGPVAPLYRFKTEADAIRMANDTEFGLAGYFYSRDIGRVWRVAEALEQGIVSVNVGAFSNEMAPFGGVKQSGIGREGSKYGIGDFVAIKYICMGGIDR